MFYFYKKIKTDPSLLVMSIFAFFMGYVFGFIVSLEQLMIGGPGLFFAYYTTGILFDTFHAVGNLCFYLVCAPILMKIFMKEIKVF